MKKIRLEEWIKKFLTNVVICLGIAIILSIAILTSFDVESLFSPKEVPFVQPTVTTMVISNQVPQVSAPLVVPVIEQEQEQKGWILADGTDVDDLLHHMEWKESRYRYWKIGKCGEVGGLQIRAIYLKDVNDWIGPKEMKKIWGKSRLSLSDMKNREKARWVTKVYMEKYGSIYEHRTRRNFTAEVFARIHNGGPDGWKEKKTKHYWYDVKNHMMSDGSQVLVASR